MTPQTLDLPSEPAEALRALREASHGRPVLVFKKSPICSVSDAAESQLQSWLAEDPDAVLAVIDVVAERALARGLCAELGIEHESPQALLFCAGELRWHDSHFKLTREAFAVALDAC